MPVSNPRRDGKPSITRKVSECDGCGRVIPKGSEVVIWHVWREGCKYRLRFCSDCLEVIYGCDHIGHFDISQDMYQYFCRERCSRCDEFPLCDRAAYLERDVGEVWYGGLDVDVCVD